jgi:hypothetical protein
MSRWWCYWRKKGHMPKRIVESYHSIDSSKLYAFKEGEELTVHGCKIKLFSSYSLFSLPSESEYRYRISAVTTPCNYGGHRHWFLCPIPKCKRRSKKIYLFSEGVFICRKCLKLAYSTQNRSKLDRIIDKKWALIRKLGADSDCILDNQKPKGMHWNTFEKIRSEIASLDEQAVFGIATM